MSRKTTEKARTHDLEYLGELTERILESAHDIIVAADREGLVTFFNPAAEDFSGFKREEILGTHLCNLYRDPADCLKSLEIIVESGQGHTYEAPVVTKVGKERILSISRSPLKDAKGDIIGFVSSSRDITEERRARETIKVLEDFRKQILDSTHDSIVATDRDGSITFFNRAAQRITGYDPMEVLGKHICDFEPDPEACKETFEHVAASNRVATFETGIITKDGGQRHLLVARAPLHDQKGAVTGFVSSSRDVTEERKALEKVRELQEFSEQVLQSAHDLISVTDTEGRITYVNKAWEEVTGYSAEEAAGLRVSALYRDPEFSDRQIREVERSGAAHSYNAVIVDKEGHEHYLSVNKGPLRDRENKLIGFVAVSRDYTERRHTIETLEHVQHFLEQILNSAHDIIVATDAEGRITYYNKAATEATGYTQAEAVGRDISEMYKDPDYSESQIDLIRKTGEVNSYEAVIIAKDGSEHFLSVNKAPLKDPGGAVSGYVAVSRDITQRKKAEQKVRELSSILSRDPSMRVEPYLLRKQVSEIMNARPVTCRHDESIGSVLKKLIESDAPLLPVLDDDGRTPGTISLKDLAAVRLFGEQDWRGKKAREFINRRFFTVDKNSLFFDALAIMVKNRADSLIVQDRGYLVGVLSNADILKFRGLGVLNIVDFIDRREHIENLAEVRTHVNHFIQSLLAEGALPAQICNIITEFNDRITRRVLEIVTGELGKPPAPFAWMGLGSEGRKEQTLVTDQDNALIIDCPEPMDPGVMGYFEQLSQKTTDALVRCGFPLCPGNMMASNPDWTGTPQTWLDRIGNWIEEPTDEHLLAFTTFADLRFLYGDESLFESFRRAFLEMFSKNPHSLSYIAEAALRQSPPVNLFRQFIVEKSGPHKGQLNIKNHGTLMVINLVRVFALANGVVETNTWERIDGLKAREVFTPQEAESLHQAFNHLMSLRLDNMVAAMRDNRDPGNFITPQRLSPWSQRMLKEAFEVINSVNKLGREIFWWLK